MATPARLAERVGPPRDPVTHQVRPVRTVDSGGAGLPRGPVTSAVSCRVVPLELRRHVLAMARRSCAAVRDLRSLGLASPARRPTPPRVGLSEAVEEDV